MRSLLWKEWHEQRWKLAFGSLILAAFALIGLRARVVADAALLQGIGILAVLLLPVLASTGLFPAERSDGSLPALFSLPVSPWAIFAMKSAVGVILCAVPIAVTAIVSILVAGGREAPSNAIAALFFRTLLVALSLYFWMLALTIRLPTETRAAMIAVGVLIFWSIATTGLPRTAPDAGVVSPTLWLFAPPVFLLGFIDRGAEQGWAVSLVLAAFVQLAISALLWTWAGWRIARSGGTIMKQLTALVWKEWIEVRVFLAIGLFTFLGLPLIGLLQEIVRQGHGDIDASIWVYTLGGLLSVIVGVGIVVRDMDGRLEQFWRSRPVSTARWLLVKYFTGLLTILATLILPLLAELVMNRKRPFMTVDVGFILAWSPFFWTAVYSIAFALACLIRRGAHAAMLAIAALLLLYFLPSILPPLEFLSVSGAIDQSAYPKRDRFDELMPVYHSIPWINGPLYFQAKQVGFIGGMLLLCVAGVGISVQALRRDWRIEADRRIIYWSIGGALLILFASTAVQVATNLPLLSKADLPHEEFIDQIQADGSHGIMVGWTTSQDGHRQAPMIHRLTIKPTSIQFGPAIKVLDFSLSGRTVLWRPEHPDSLYYLDGRWFGEHEEEFEPSLTTINLHGGSAEVAKIACPDQRTHDWAYGLAAWKDRLFLLGPKLSTFDISDPEKPRLISTEEITWTPPWRDLNQAQAALLSFRSPVDPPQAAEISLPPVPQLTARQRLELLLNCSWSPATLDGDILVYDRGPALITYRLTQLTDTLATFKKLGTYTPAGAERLFYTFYRGRAAAAGGQYIQDMESWLLDSGGITVFDITGSRPVVTGHFAIPRERVNYAGNSHPLPDGRSIVTSSNSVYLLGPPPGREP